MKTRCLALASLGIVLSVGGARGVAQTSKPLTEAERQFVESVRQLIKGAESKPRQEFILKWTPRLISGDYYERTQAMSTLSNLPEAEGVPFYRGLLNHVFPDVALMASVQLARFPAQAKEDVPTILKLLDANHTHHYGHYAFGALLKIAPDDPQVVAALERTLLAPSMNIYYAESLCEAAGEAGAAASNLKSALKKMLTFRPDWLAHAAFAALGKVEGGATNMSVPVALEVLNQWPQTTPEKMSVAMLALQNAEAKGKPALPRLVQLWGNQEPPYLRHAVIRTIGKIGPGSNAEATKLLFNALEHNSQRWRADTALKNFRAGEVEAVPVLTAALSTHPTIAGEALGKIGPAAQPAAAQLIKLVEAREKSNYTNIEPMALGLKGIGTQAKGASQMALKVLDRWEIDTDNSRDYGIRGLLLAIIAKTDTPTAAESRNRVLAHIASVFKAPWRWNQTDALGATMAAGAIGPEAAAIVPNLVRVIELDHADQGHNADFHGTYLWTNHSQDGQPDRWKSNLRFLRVEAIRALAKMGAAAEPAIPALTKIASITNPAQPNYGLRKEAAQALRALGKAELVVVN